MATTARIQRQKISTTVAPETLAYLEQIIGSGEADTLAEAIDIAVVRLRMIENRERLERDTAAYFDSLTPAESAEEDRLATALSQAARGIDFDREP
jgi:hypothetical protein